MRVAPTITALLSVFLSCTALAPLALAATVVPGDMNGDGVVGMDDLPGFMAAWNAFKAGQAWNPAADLDGDGKVTAADADMLMAAILEGANYPTGPALTPAEIDQYNSTVAAVETQFQAFGGGTTAAQQVVDWALAQGLATDGMAASDGTSYSLLLPSGVGVAWLAAEGSVTTTSAAVRPQDVSQTPDVLCGPGSKIAAVFSDGTSAWHDESMLAVASVLKGHGYNCRVRGAGVWDAASLPSICSGASVVYFDTHGAWCKVHNGLGGPVSSHPALLTPQLCYSDFLYPDTDGAKQRDAWLKAGYLCIGLVLDASGHEQRYYCFTDLFARDFIRGLQGALVVVMGCQTGCQVWYDALNSFLPQVAAAAGFPMGPNTFMPANVKLGPALFEFLSADRDPSDVLTSTIPTGALPAGNTADNPLNLGNAVGVENAWFPGAFPLLFLAAEAWPGSVTTQMVCYPAGSTWGLIPHLDKVTWEATGLTLWGDFGDGTGQVQGDDGSGSWAPSMTMTVTDRTRPHQDIVVVYPTGVTQIRYRSPAGLLSNELPVDGVASVSVDPSLVSLAKPGDEATLTATAYAADGTALPLPDSLWSWTTAPAGIVSIIGTGHTVAVNALAGGAAEAVVETKAIIDSTTGLPLSASAMVTVFPWAGTYSGTYSGTFTRYDGGTVPPISGTWTITVDGTGALSGSAYDGITGTTALVGTVDAAGDAAAVGSGLVHADYTGKFVVKGGIRTLTGAYTSSNARGYGSGTFSGSETK